MPCLAQSPTQKFSLMIWDCVTLNAVGTITVVGVNMNAQKYIDIMYTCGQLLQDIFLGKIISSKIIMRPYTELVLSARI